jgi:Ca-activated chloride channel family protein
MRFLWPDLLWLLVLVPVLVAAYLWLLSRRKRSALRFTDLARVRQAIGSSQRVRRHLPPALLLVAVLLALLALARPSTVFTLPSQHQTIVLAMDVSRSMRVTDVEPNRISAAQAAAKSFIEELPSNVRVGIVSFAGTAAVVQTPTESKEDLIAAIDRFQLQMGTATGSGLLVSLSLLFPDDGIDLESAVFGGRFARSGGGPAAIDQARRTDRPAKREVAPVPPGSFTGGAVILLSDGRRTTGPDPLEAAKLAADRGVRVHTVGFGTREGGVLSQDEWSIYVRLDEETLKAVAGITHGEYFYAGTAADLKKVYQNINAKFSMERRETEIGALLSAAAALCIVAALGLTTLWFRQPV